MAQHQDVALLGKERCGRDIVTCRFTRPEGYEFAAGQWFRLTLGTEDGELTETFSHCSAPADPELEMTTRLTGTAFKRALDALEPGGHAAITGPGGRLAVPPSVERIAFLVGGVGITPVRSILRDARARGRVFADACLFFGNRDEGCTPFVAELSAMNDIGARLILCYEQPTERWDGERGFITAEMVRRHLDPADGRTFLVAGPPVMVGAMEAVLDTLGIEAERRIVERFGATAS